MDQAIRDQGYVYFLSEAPELLQTVEDGLLQLHDAPRVQNIHALMRATHTLKGAAANVGLKTIETVAHSLEDAFKALYNESVDIDLEMEQLLLEGYECLRVPLGAELAGTKCNEDDVLERATVLFEKLRDKLGDDFGQQEYIPTSAELGFDITQSIFEMGVQERLDELSAAVSSGDAGQVTSVLTAGCEVFVGLGESLGLMGWSELAKTAGKALELNPDRALEIGTVALADFKAGHHAVLKGDRESGGTVSPALHALATTTNPAPPPLGEILRIDTLDTSFDVVEAPAVESVSEPDLGQTDLSALDRDDPDSRLPEIQPPMVVTPSELEALEELESLSSIDLDDLDELEELSPAPAPRRLELDLTRFEAFLGDSQYGQPVGDKIRQFFLKLVRVLAHWQAADTGEAVDDFGLDNLIPVLAEAKLRNKQAAVSAVKTLRDLGDRFLEAISTADESPSYQLYRKWTFLSAMVAIAKCQYSALTNYPKSFKDVMFVVALRQLAQNTGKRYQTLPPVPARDRQWLETPTVEQLLQPPAPEPEISGSEISKAVDDATLLEEVWGGLDDEIPIETAMDGLAGPTSLPPVEAASIAEPATNSVIDAVTEAGVPAQAPLPPADAALPGEPIGEPITDTEPSAPITVTLADRAPDATGPSSNKSNGTEFNSSPALPVTALPPRTQPPAATLATESSSSVASRDIHVSVAQTVDSRKVEPHVSQGEFAEEEKAAPEAANRKPTETRQLVSVDLAGIERLNHRLGELLIEQNRLYLDEERLFETTKAMRLQIQQHQKTMAQALEWSEQIMGLLEHAGAAYEGRTIAPDGSIALSQLDSVDFDGYADLHLTLKTALQESLELSLKTDEVGSLVRGSGQAMDKQKQLLSVMQDDLVDVRMLPLQEILDRFQLVLRQLSRIQGKHIDLQISGGELAIEQGVAQKLYDPLLHLVRNAFDHGIEDSDTRRSLGKPAEGTIEIRAYNQGTQTTIEVRDDGRGLDVDSIRRKAVEKEFLTQEEANRTISAERLDILFEPGFSTAAKVSEISGRGVGLDVVRTQIQNLKGTISVRSELGRGTVFALQIPLSLTIAKLLVVQAGGSAYALLLDAIEKIVMPLPGQTRLFENSKVLQIGEGDDTSMVSVRQLADLMHYTSSLVSLAEEPTKGVMSISRDVSAPILLLRHNKKYLGLEVDHIIGEQELVIRPLGSAIAPPGYVYGCSILGDSSLCLVIDGGEMIEQALMPLRSAAAPALTGFQSFAIDAPACDIAASPNPKSLAPTSESRPRTSLELGTAEVNDAKPEEAPRLLLIVDDSINLRHTLSLTLQKAGYQVIQARDGLEALEQLEQSPGVQLVLCDVEMPRMNGFEFLGTYRQKSDVDQVPVITLTSHSSQKYRQIASSLGASAYLTKPYSESELLSAVSELI